MYFNSASDLDRLYWIQEQGTNLPKLENKPDDQPFLMAFVAT